MTEVFVFGNSKPYKRQYFWRAFAYFCPLEQKWFACVDAFENDDLYSVDGSLIEGPYQDSSIALKHANKMIDRTNKQ